MPGRGMGLAVAAATAPRRASTPAGPPTLGKEAAGLLAAVPLFSGLSPRQLRRVAKLTHQVRFQPGSLIIQAGQPGRAFFVLVEGSARVTRDPAGGGRTLNRLKEGDFFGEFALLDGGPRTASVVAETAVSAYRLSRPDFKRLLAREAQLSIRLLEGIASRARAGDQVGTE